MSPRRTVAVTAIAVTLAGAGCSSTGEPGHTAAIDVVTVDADGVDQTLTGVSDRFDRVTVTTATYGREPVDGRLELTVTPATGDEVRRSAASGADIRDNAPLTLTFEPLDVSDGGAVTLTFTYAGEHPVALYRNPHDPYADGELDAGGDLVFTLGHADRVRGAVGALGRAAREAAATATRDPLFLGVWLAGLAALVVAGFRLRSPAGGRDGSSP